MVIATDGRDNWRKKIFPYYKAHRQKSRNKRLIDWKKIYELMNTLREELKEYFPYPVIHLDETEGDDIIACLCWGGDFVTDDDFDRILILSSDKDFGQLQMLCHVYQYDPIRKREIVIDKPADFLKEHIIRGDASDGIPNILSPDSVIVSGGRQHKMTAQRFHSFMFSEPEHYDDEPKRNYFRNEALIDLRNIPKKLIEDIKQEYLSQINKEPKKLFNYFMDKGLRNLISDIGDFK